VELGKNPASNELLTGIFRTIHTIERTGGAIGLKYRLRKKPIYYMT
jgi:chemotaxis protein histidine kinase CheA